MIRKEGLEEKQKGSIWFSDAVGPIFRGTLVDFDPGKGRLWVNATRECSETVDVVVILKKDLSFPSGKKEWCGQARLVKKDCLQEKGEGYLRLCLEIIT